MADRQQLHSDRLGQPIGLYSHGFLAPSHGSDLYVAGQLSVGTNGEVVAPTDFEAQMRQVFANFAAVLAAASLTFDHVVKFTTYLISPDDIENFYAVRARLFPELFSQPEYPPNTLLVVQRLVRPEFRIEVEGVAREMAATAVVTGILPS